MIPIAEERSALSSLVRVLRWCLDCRFTGSVRVLGSPGAVLSLRGGAVAEVRSPGAPGIDALLLRSGRLGEEDWAAAADAPLERLPRYGAVRSVELRLVAATAWEDAVFAALIGRVDGLVPVPDTRARPPAAVPVDIELLLAGVERKVAAISRMTPELSIFGDRLIALPQSAARPATPRQRALLSGADGRRTARDLAFLVGRGVYPVAADLAVLLGDGLLQVAADCRSVHVGQRPHAVPRVPGTAAPPAPGSPLPRRRPRPPRRI